MKVDSDVALYCSGTPARAAFTRDRRASARERSAASRAIRSARSCSIEREPEPAEPECAVRESSAELPCNEETALFEDAEADAKGSCLPMARDCCEEAAEGEGSEGRVRESRYFFEASS